MYLSIIVFIGCILLGYSKIKTWELSISVLSLFAFTLLFIVTRK